MEATEAIELLKTETDRCSMSLSVDTLTDFRSYLEVLYEYNQKVNLVSNADPEVVVKRHLLDCLALVEVINCLEDPKLKSGEPKRLIDIGSGAGLPGLVIAIAVKDLEVVLLDSVGKKTKFLEEAAGTLGLSNRVSVVTDRAEELARTSDRATYDLATSRAVGHLGMVIELAMPFLKVGGRILCQKSRNQVETEIAEIKNLLSPIGAKKAEIIVPKIQVGEIEHVIVSIEKQNDTPNKFPRPWSEIIRRWK